MSLKEHLGILRLARHRREGIYGLRLRLGCLVEEMGITVRDLSNITARVNAHQPSSSSSSSQPSSSSGQTSSSQPPSSSQMP
ncbi:hypothetical protein SLEP1_g19233 [Rubroshorea leprosula]|nr:hypothetical protein SLEP1_g19233 [Rubroshorea leprosula]